LALLYSNFMPDSDKSWRVSPSARKRSKDYAPLGVLVVFASLLRVVALGLVLLPPSLGKASDANPGSPVVVESTVQGTIGTVRQIIEKTLSDKNRKTLPRKFQLFSLVSASDAVFPSRYDLQRLSRADPTLRLYVSKLPSGHQDDYYFFDPVREKYWSTTNASGQVIREFRCSFIIHLEGKTNALTAISVFEYAPEIRNGKRFEIGHAGPGLYWNINPTISTISDRLELLSIISNSLSVK